MARVGWVVMAPPTDRRARARITTALFAAQALGSAGVLAAATVASIAGAEISGRTSLAGVPAGVFQLGAAVSALVWSVASDRLGRRNGLGLGLLAGAIGAAGATLAVIAHSFPLLVAAIVVMGSGSAAVRLGRFAAAEVHPPARRGRAVAWVVLGGTVGSVLGPSLVAPTGTIGHSLTGSSLAGPYAVTLVVYLLAAVTLLVFLRPDPKALGEQIERHHPHPGGVGRARRWSSLLRDPGIVVAMASVIVAHAVMVMMMGLTSLHMVLAGIGLGGISLVFSVHSFGMYAPSVGSGWLADRFGRHATITAGAVTLAGACALAPLSDRVPALVLALFLLGLGWNLCFVAGSALLADRLAPAEKGRMQGLNDLLMSGMAAVASLAGGLLFATAGYGGMGLVGVLASVLLLALVLSLGRASRGRPNGADEWG